MSRHFTVIECAQRTPEWFAARAGLLTGSVAGDVLAKIKSGEAAARRNLRLRLALERITGLAQDGDGFISKAMQEGTDREPLAISAYEVSTGNVVQLVGFVRHDQHAMGYSPDGVVGDYAGLVEVKCPEPAAHLDHLEGKISQKYLAQMAHGLWVTGAAYCDFVSFHPLFPDRGQLSVRRFTREIVASYAAEALAFLGEIDAEVKRITSIVEAA